MAKRKAIPAAIERQLLEECGYRCALPGCGETVGLQKAHIEPHSETQDDDFDNLIMLCGTDHYRYDKLGQITRESIRTYKRNLAVMNGRYNDFERRLLERFHEKGLDSRVELEHSTTLELSIRNLLRDDILTTQVADLGTVTYESGITVMTIPGAKFETTASVPMPPGARRPDGAIVERTGGTDHYSLTPAGHALVQRWFGATPIDPSFI